MTTFLFIGQAPPRVDADLPFGRTHLYKWFERVGISQEMLLANSQFTALTTHFPGASAHGHKAPPLAEIITERPRIRHLIAEVTPKVIIPVGILSIRELLGNPDLTLDETVGNAYPFTLYPDYESTAVVPLPHPSGASPWVYMNGHDALLNKALGQAERFLTNFTL